MLKQQKGFTLIELMIVVIVIGILAAIGIPNYLVMSSRAKEGGVKSNMHTLQLAVEDYAIQNNGLYPQAADAAGVVALLPGGNPPRNPFTTNPTVVSWDADPASDGDIAVNPATQTVYVIKGAGLGGALLSLEISNE